MLYLIFAAVFVVLIAAWFLFGDADWSTLFVHVFLQSRREKYKNKVVWITGASSGIGEQIAYIFAKLGCRLVICGTREIELRRVEETCKTLNSECDVMIICGNIAETWRHADYLKDVTERFGEIDVLVNNAGRSQRSDFAKIPNETEKDLFEVNFFAVASLTKLIVGKWLQERSADKGILVTSSTAGKLGAPFSATYCASKHALHGYFESLRSELCVQEYKMQITLACPGPVRSNIRVMAFTDVVGKIYNMPDTDDQKLLDTKRCAELMVSAFVAGLDETWISRQPILFVYYLAQYIPSYFRLWLLPLVMNKKAHKMRDGRN